MALLSKIKKIYNKIFLHNKFYEILDFPFPYESMLSINSDVEYTTWETQEFLIKLFKKNKLEVAFSFWCLCDPKIAWRLFDEN